MLDMNLTGSFLCAPNFGLRMREWGWGHLLISPMSLANARGRLYSLLRIKGVRNYAHARVGLELAPEVLVNAILSGPVLFQDETPEPVRQREIDQTLANTPGLRKKLRNWSSLSLNPTTAPADCST